MSFKKLANVARASVRFATFGKLGRKSGPNADPPTRKNSTPAVDNTPQPTTLNAKVEAAPRSPVVDDSKHPVVADIKPPRERLPAPALPSEILLKIIDPLIYTYYILEKEPATHGNALIVFSAVCSQWRSVLLDVPEYWSYVRQAPPNRVALHVERAGDLPLTVTYTSIDKGQPEGAILGPVVMALGHLTRIRSLRLELDTKAMEQITQLLRGQNAPILEACDFRLLKQDGTEELMDSEAFMPLAPSLRSLKLRNTIAVQTLTKLGIDLRELSFVCENRATAPFAIPALLGAVTKMKDLEHLSLQGVVDISSRFTPVETMAWKPAVVPKPKTIEISETLNNTCVILYNLDLDDLEHLTVHVAEHTVETDTTLTRLVITLATWIQKMSVEHDGSFIRVNTDDKGVTLEVNAQNRNKFVRTLNIRFHQSGHMTMKDVVHSHGFTLFLATIKPQELQLYMQDEHGPDCLSILAQCPSARTLWFDGSLTVFDGLNRLGPELRLRILFAVDILILQSVTFTDELVEYIKNSFEPTNKRLRDMYIRKSNGLTEDNLKTLKTLSRWVEEERG